MKQAQTFTLTPELAAQYGFGQEHQGTYIINQLNAKEYLQAAEELTQQKRLESQTQGETFKGQLNETDLRNAIFYKTVTKDGQPLAQDIPSKLYEILAFVAIPLNMLSQDEGTALLKLFRPATTN
jgi:hypothetical protein